MQVNLSKNRSFNWVKILIGSLLLIAVIGILTFNQNQAFNDAVNATRPKVFNNIKTQFVDVRRIKITIPDGSFNIKKNENIWNVVERSNYPASSVRIEKLASQLALLEKGDLVSSDPSQFDTYGVGEPVEFGFGTIIELFDSQDQLIAASHIGQKDGKIYVRKMGDNNFYLAHGELIEIGNITQWLDYDILPIKAEDIKQVETTNLQQKPYLISRDAAGNFNIDNNNNSKITNAANAISGLKIVDIAPKSRLAVDAFSTQLYELNDGTQLEIKHYKQNAMNWVKINAVNKSTELGARLNLKTKDWIFAIDSENAKLMTKSKANILAN